MTSPDIHVEFDIGLTTDIGATYRRVSEDGYVEQPMTLLDAIIDRAAAKLAAECTRDDRGEILREARARVDGLIRERLAPVIDEMLAGTFRLTDQYGSPKGEEVTLREYVVQQSRKMLTQNPGHFGSSNDTPLDAAVKMIVQPVLKKELADQIAAAKAQLTADLAHNFAAVVAQQFVSSVQIPSVTR